MRDQVMLSQDKKEIRLSGIGGSPGICIGKAYLVGKEGVDVVEKYSIEKNRLADEIKRFKAAVKSAKDELHEIIRLTGDELQEHAYILETQMVLFKDKMLYDKTIETIQEECVNAEWALKKVVSNVKAMFNSMADQYLKGRVDDIVHVSDSIMRNLVGVSTENIAAIDKRVILIADNLSPAETSQIQLEKVRGFVTNRGGTASHTGIIARSLEIPAVLGLADATEIIRNDDIIIVDGTAGIVIVHPLDKTLIQFEESKERYEVYKADITRDSYLPAETADGMHLSIMGNIELPEEVVSVLRYGGDGIGLYRTEFQYLGRPDFPDEDELFDRYKDVVEVMAPKSVTIRTLDINGDKALSGDPECGETNPVLGLRGIRYCLKKPEIFKTQIRAILRASAFGKIRILFPMVSCHEEIIEAKKILKDVEVSLEKEGIKFDKNIEIGIMIEVPSAVILADVMAKDVDFFSIGTNDLVQFSLAVDRGNRQVAHLYHTLHPAVIRMIKSVADAAKDNNIKVFMCGEMAGDPVNIPILLGLGIDRLSMNPQSIPGVKRMIRSLNVKDAKPFLKEVLKKTSTRCISDLVMDTYGGIVSEQGYRD